jgi:hypothetical protein
METNLRNFRVKKVFKNSKREKMKDIVLGEIIKDEDSYLAEITYVSNSIKIYIDLDTGSLEQSIEVAQSLVASIEEFDNLSKEILARDLLETYNDNWSSYEEVQDDGSTIHVTNPTLSKDAFISKLTLTSMSVTDDKFINLSYDDSYLFWGHQPTVSSSEGLDFSNAKGNI